MKVLIVGGGVGGLSASIALRRAGFEVQVVERDPAWGVYGVGIIQPANALRALADLGLAAACVEVGHPIRGDRTFLADGVTQLAAHEWPVQVEGLPPGNGITRPNLHEILKRATLASGATVRTGLTPSRITNAADQVEVVFADGTEGSYDLVVAADGLYSSTRASLFDPDLKPGFTGQVCWRYNLPLLDGLEEILVYVGPLGTLGFVPLAHDLMYAFLIEAPPEGQEQAIQRDGAAAVLRQRLASYGGPITGLLDHINDDDAVVLRPIETVLAPAPWYRGRVVLIGDAAHGTSPHCGQGAAQAIEDGIVLADELSRGVTVEQALEAFTLRRFERCKAIKEGSEAIGRWEQDHSLPIDPVATRVSVGMTASAPI